MKYSKTSAILLAAAIVLQLAIPALFVTEKSRILQNGDEYRIRVNSLSFADDMIELDYEITNNWDSDEMRYAVPENEYQGVYMWLRLTKEPPASGVFMQSASVREYRSPIGEYAFPDIDADKASHTFSELYDYGHFFYAAVKIYHGKALLTGVYLDDGTPVEQLFD